MPKNKHERDEWCKEKIWTDIQFLLMDQWYKRSVSVHIEVKSITRLGWLSYQPNPLFSNFIIQYLEALEGGLDLKKVEYESIASVFKEKNEDGWDGWYNWKEVHQKLIKQNSEVVK